MSLPNSKIEIDVPVYYFAPSKAQKDEGVIPDVVVKKQPADVGNDFDREVSKIKTLINGK